MRLFIKKLKSVVTTLIAFGYENNKRLTTDYLNAIL